MATDDIHRTAEQYHRLAATALAFSEKRRAEAARHRQRIRDQVSYDLHQRAGARRLWWARLRRVRPAVSASQIDYVTDRLASQSPRWCAAVEDEKWYGRQATEYAALAQSAAATERGH